MWFARLRWWRAALLGALAVLGLVLVISWVLLRVYGPTFTRERVEALLSEALAQPVRVGAVRLSPWRLRLSLADLDVPGAPPDGVRLRAAAIAVSVDVASLWRRELILSVLVTDVRLDMAVPETEAAGVSIFPLPRYFAVGPVRVGIGSIRIKDGLATIRLPEGAAIVTVQGADVSARPAGGDLDVSGRIDALGVDALGRRDQIERVAVDGRLSADAAVIQRIGWRWHGEAMQLHGEVRRPWTASRELALQARGEIALAALAKAVGVDERVDGKAQVTAEVTGPVEAPSIAGRVRIPELRLAGVAARDVLIDGQWGDRKLRLDDVQARLGAGRMRARLETAPIADGGARVALDLRELVLPGSLTGLGPAIGVAEGKVRDGGVDLERAEVKWRGVEVALDGRIAGGPALAVRGTIVADLRELGDALKLGPLSGRARVSAELTGRGGAQAIEGRAQIADLVAAGHAVEPVEASFRIAASPGPATRWTGTVESPRVRWDEVAVESIAASLAVDGTRIELIRARARALAVPIEVSGVWNWTGSGRGHATCGPVALAGISGVPAVLQLAGTGRASVDASVDRGATSASALVELERVSAAGVPLGAGRVEVRLRGQALAGELAFPARRLSVRTTGRLEAGGALTSSLELDDLALQPLLRDLGSAAADHVEGRLSSRAELSIPLGQPGRGHGVARVTLDGLRLFGEPWATRGPIVLGWQDQRLTVEQFRLDGPAGRLGATGSLIGPDDRGLSLTLDNARLPGALAALGQGTVRSEIRLAGERLELARFDARWPHLTAMASGQAGGDGAVDIRARVDADLAGLGPAVGISAMAGRATLTAEARGRGEAIEVAGAVRAPRIQVGGTPVSEVELPFQLTRSSARIAQARARLGASRIAADGSATWNGTGAMTAESLARDTQVTAEVRAPAVRLEDLASLLPAALAGRGELALAVRAEGTPRAWRGAGTLTSPLLESRAGPLRQLRAAFSVDQTRAEVTDLRVDALGIPTRATASWAWAGGGSAKATLGPAPLAGLAIVPAAAGLHGTGRVTIEAAMRSPADVTGTVRAQLDDVAVGGVAFGRGHIDVSARDGAFHAEVAFPESRLQASGSGRIDAAGTLTAEAAAPGIDLGLFTKALGVPGAPTGTLSARATARVPFADPQKGEGVLSIDPVRLVVADDEWRNQGPIEVRWARGEVSLAAFRLAAKDGLVSGAGTLAAGGKLDVHVSAKAPLALLRAVRPEIQEIGGILDLSVRASGSLASPSITGDGAIHRGNLLLRDRPETLRDVEARLILSSQGVQLRDATGLLGGGRVQARGDLALRNWQPGAYRVRLQAQNVAVGQIEGFSSAWDADLELSGLTREAQLEGRARLVRGLYNRDLSILSLALSQSRAPAADTGPGLRVRVRVDLDDNLVVRNRIADLRAGGVLSVEGTTVRPVIFGSIESRDGRIVFRGRDWSVTSAIVRFADPRRLDPYLDVSAAARIGDYDVTMQITGPVSNVAVRFSSTPRLSQNDLLSLVAFGVTGADLRESPTTVLLGEAGKLLAENVLGIEPSATGLRISTGSATTSAANELRGFPGEERSTVGPSQYTSNAPGSRRERVRVEYQLFAPLYLSAEYDREGGYGGDVILRFRFR
jgi:autotransporter translocation and assembly factor TamB